MPQQPDQPGKPASAPKGVGVADAFARLNETLARAASRGNPASPKKRLADQRLQEAIGAFGEAIGQATAAPRPAGMGKTIDRERAMGHGMRVIGLACPAPCGDAG